MISERRKDLYWINIETMKQGNKANPTINGGRRKIKALIDNWGKIDK